MNNANSEEIYPIYKYSRGKWKELGAEKNTGSNSENSNLDEFKLQNLNDKSIIELEELISRQEKLLNNKAFTSKLKDKGKKIRETYGCLQKALKDARAKEEFNKQKKDASTHIKNVNSLEWNGSGTDSLSEKEPPSHQEFTKSIENEEDNPLKLLARHSVEYPLDSVRRYEEEKDYVKEIQDELERLRIQDDEQTISSEKEPTSVERTSETYSEKLLRTLNDHKEGSRKPRFKTNRSLKSLSENLTTNQNECKPVKLISLEESLSLLSQTNKADSLKMKSEAAKKLREIQSSNQLPSDSPASNFKLPTSSSLCYRDVNTPQHILNDYLDEVQDFISPEIDSEEEEEET